MIHLFDLFDINISPNYSKRNRTNIRILFFNQYKTNKFKYIKIKSHRIIKDLEYNFIFEPNEFQKLEEIKCNHYKGLCAYWCMWYILLRLNNHGIHPIELLKYSKEQLKQYGVSIYIFKFTNYLHLIYKL